MSCSAGNLDCSNVPDGAGSVVGLIGVTDEEDALVSPGTGFTGMELMAFPFDRSSVAQRIANHSQVRVAVVVADSRIRRHAPTDGQERKPVTFKTIDLRPKESSPLSQGALRPSGVDRSRLAPETDRVPRSSLDVAALARDEWNRKRRVAGGTLTIRQTTDRPLPAACRGRRFSPSKRPLEFLLPGSGSRQ